MLPAEPPKDPAEHLARARDGTAEGSGGVADRFAERLAGA